MGVVQLSPKVFTSFTSLTDFDFTNIVYLHCTMKLLIVSILCVVFVGCVVSVPTGTGEGPVAFDPDLFDRQDGVQYERQDGVQYERQDGVQYERISKLKKKKCKKNCISFKKSEERDV